MQGEKSFDFITELKNYAKGVDKSELFKNDKDVIARRQIFVILSACHIAAFLQATGYFIQHNAYPYLTKSLGVNPQVYGYLMSFTAVVQLLGGPFCGRLGDIYGGRLPLLISFISLAISCALKGFTTNIPFLFLASVPMFLSHALQSTYLIMSDITTNQQRADMLGKLGVSHGLGMIVGSTLGGIITENLGKTASFFIGSIVFSLCIFITLSLIPQQTKHIRKEMDSCADRSSSGEDGKQTSFLGICELIEVAKTKHVAYVLTLKVLTGFPFSVLSSMFTYVIMEYYKLGPKQNGIVLAYLGVVGMITQGLLVGYLTQRIADAPLIIVSVITMAIGFLYLIISQSIYLFCVVSIPLTIGASLIHVIITSLITKIVPDDLTGAALGLTLGTHAILRTIAPTIGGLFFSRIGFFSFGLLGYVTDFSIAVYLIFFGRTTFL